MTAEQTPIDVNTASLKELVSLSGIGESLAKRIIEQRPYTSLSELIKVSGISNVKLNALSPFLTVGAEKEIIVRPARLPAPGKSMKKKPDARLGNTETFIFLEDQNERQDALLIILGGFLFGLIILFLRRSSR